MFECKGIINLESLNEIKKYTLAPWRKVFFICMLALSVCLLGLAIFLFDHTYIIITSALLCVLVFEYFFIQHYGVKTTLKRMREVSHTEKCEYTYTFDDSGIKIENHATNGVGTMGYDVIKRFINTENYFTLVTKARQFTIVAKNSCDEDEFLAHIRRKCPNVKMQGCN